MNSRKYSVNDNFFSCIDSEEKAYWMGFMSADGNISTHKNNKSKVIELSLQSSDSKHLFKFAKCIESNNPIKVDSIRARISFTSKQIYDDLLSKGIGERKSCVVKFSAEDIIPKELMHHYVRGLFDGDGGFYFYKKENTYRIHFCGTIDVCNGVLKILQKSDEVNVYVPNNSKNYGEVYIKGNENALKAAEIMYKDATLYLDRKFEQYNALKDLIQSNKTNNQIRESKKEKITENMIKMHQSGMSYTEIAKHYNYALTNVSRILNNYSKLNMLNNEKRVIDLVNSGITNKSQIQRITGFSRDYIRKIMAQYK